jgi:hypothetical protein
VQLRDGADLPVLPPWTPDDYSRRDAELAKLGIQFKRKKERNDDSDQ